MATKSLKQRIEDVVSSLPPSLPQIKGELMQCVRLAQALEDGQAPLEQESTVGDLEAQLGDLKVALQTANTEIERFRREEREREKKDRQIDDPKQFEILARLPTENRGGLMTFAQIIEAVPMSFEEAEVRMDNLRKGGLVKRGETFTGHIAWERTMEGTKLVLARQLAGEKDA